MEWVIVIVIFVVIGVALALAQLTYVRRNREMISAGKIIKRDISFEGYAEIFTLSNADFAKVVSALKTMDISDAGVSWESKGATRTVDFKSIHEWTARLMALKSSGERYRYSFQFTGWQTHKGVTWRSDTMNMLLTGIEKVFLSLDPNTQLGTEQLKTKSKPSFF